MSGSLVKRMGPEAILAAVFAQAFVGGTFKLPAGVTELTCAPRYRWSLPHRREFMSKSGLASMPITMLPRRLLPSDQASSHGQFC